MAPLVTLVVVLLGVETVAVRGRKELETEQKKVFYSNLFTFKAWVCTSCDHCDNEGGSCHVIDGCGYGGH